MYHDSFSTAVQAVSLFYVNNSGRRRCVDKSSRDSHNIRSIYAPFLPFYNDSIVSI